MTKSLDKKIELFEFGLNKKLVENAPGPSVGDHFRLLQNFRYMDTHLQGIAGMSKMNQTSLGGHIRNGSNFIREESGENYIIVQGENEAGDESAIYTSSSPQYNVHTNYSLASATFLDEKGSITTFTVDTANTSGHFDAAVSSRIKAGCRIVISGTNYTITSISDDGTASNSVVFSGTLTTGAKTVTGIYGGEVDTTGVRLSRNLAAASYANLYGQGDRSASVTASTTAAVGGGAIHPTILNGNTTENTFWFGSAAVAGETITFTFPVPVNITEVTWLSSANTAMGTWKWQGSNNGTDWTDLSANFAWTAQLVDTSLAANTGLYSVYRMLGVSGNTSNAPYVREVQFKITQYVYPSSTKYPASMSVDCTDWIALKALTRTETRNSQNLWYALSFDGGTTYSAFSSGAWKQVIRFSEGVWQYLNSVGAWTGAFSSAMWAMTSHANIGAYRMTGATMAGLTQAQIEGSGGFTSGQTSLPVLLALSSTSATATPLLSEMMLVHDTQAASGDFEPTPLHTDATGAEVAHFSDGPGGSMIICNCEESLIYGGNEYQVGAFIGMDSTVYTDYTEQVRNTTNDSDNRAIVPNVASPTMYLGATRPISGFKFYLNTVNSVSATIAVYYWDGDAWVAVSDMSDTTALGGKTLAITGSVSFDDTQDVAKPHLIKDVFLYWYKLVFSTTLTVGTSIYHVTVKSPIQPIRDIWDGEPRVCAGLYLDTGTAKKEYTGNVFNNVYDATDGSSYVNIGGLTSAQALYCGFTEKMRGMRLNIYGEGGNTAAATMTISYWDGDSWVSVGTLTDGTRDTAGTKTLAQSGAIIWNKPATQFQYPLVQDIPLYFYKITVSATLSATIHLFGLTGIPEPETIGAFCTPLFANNRTWLLNETHGSRNMARYSAQDSPDVWNGEDSGRFYIGGGDELTGGCQLFAQFGSSLYNMTLFFKQHEIWALIGSTPEDWTLYRISENTGCVAPLSIVRTTINAGGQPGQNQHVVFFQSEDGVYLFEGRVPVKISSDIGNYFDESKPEAIPPTMISQSFSYYDFRHDEYHFLFASGETATELNKEMVYDLRRSKWFEIVRPEGLKLQTGIMVKDQEGFRSYYGSTDGIMYELESGKTFDGEEIEHVFETGDIALADKSMNVETIIRNIKIVGNAHENAMDLTVSISCDGIEEPHEFESPFSLQKTGRTIATPRRSVGTNGSTRGIYHSIRISGATGIDSERLEIYGVGFQYEPVRYDS